MTVDTEMRLEDILFTSYSLFLPFSLLHSFCLPLFLLSSSSPHYSLPSYIYLLLSFSLFLFISFICIPHTHKIPSEDRCSGPPISRSSSLDCMKREEELLLGVINQAPLWQNSPSVLLFGFNEHLTALNSNLDCPLVPNYLFPFRRAWPRFFTAHLPSLPRAAK